MIGKIIDYEFIFLITVLLAGGLFVFDIYTIIKSVIKRRKLVKLQKKPAKIKPRQNPFTIIKKIFKSKLKWHKKIFAAFRYIQFFLNHVLLLIIISILLYNLFGISPGVQYSYPFQNQPLESYEQPIYIVFDRPINESILKTYIFPEINGVWKVEPVYDFVPFIKRKVVFYPEESMFEGNVFIYYAGITNIFGTGDKWEYGIDSYGVVLPSTAEVNTDNNPIDFPIDGKLLFVFDQNYGRQVQFDLELDPPVTSTLTQTDNNKLEVAFNSSLAQSKEYKYKLYKTPVRYNIQTGEVVDKSDNVMIKEGMFTTIREPLIQSIEPNGSEVRVNSQIKIVFDQPMIEQQVISSFSINPGVEGTFENTDNYSFIYRTGNFSKETKYDIRLLAGIKSLKGGITERDITHSFTTIGKVAVSGFNPGYNANNVGRGSNINITFNQEVDHASAQSKFSISPAIEGTFGWSGNTMVFNPTADMAYQTTYTVTIASGIKTIYGLDSNQSFSTKFTTEVQYFALNVPIYRQRYRYSCNFVATAMAVAYKTGSVKDPMALYNQVAKDNTPITCDPVTQAVVTWGNPYSGYVGDIYGAPIAGCSRSGYGVYWGPVSNVVSNYRSNTAKTGWGLQEMLQQVLNNNPVIIWAHNGYSYAGQIFYWQTPGGQTIRAVSGMHSYVVVGFIGSIDNPTSIILNDPNRGRWTISTGYFLSLWSYFNNAGIAVY